MEMMRAGVSSEDGLRLAEVARPVAGDGQLLVRVMAAGINRADLNAARGAGVAPKASLGRPIGMEWAGEVVVLGKGASGFEPGELVACSGSGGYAEYAVADTGRTISLRDGGLSVETAAALPLALMSAHDAVATNGALANGDVVLVHGATSAVGLAALQIAARSRARVIATSTSPDRFARLADFGAYAVVNSRATDWPEQVKALSGGQGANLVIDMVSGASVTDIMRATAVRGRIVNVGRLGGATRAEFDFDLHAQQRITFIGVTFRTRSASEVAEIVRAMTSDLWPDVLTGAIRLPIDRVLSLNEAPAAHDHMRSNAHFGKIVLRL